MTGDLVLIIEDNANNRLLVRDVLQVTGYRTEEAETAEEGLRLARQLMPALIVMDIELPGMSGMDALRYLRDDPATSRIPVIAVTASAMPQERGKIMAAGFDGYQSKPISVTEFLETVRATLDARRRSPDAS